MKHIKFISVFSFFVSVCMVLSACATIGKNGQNYNSNVENVTNAYTLTKEDKKDNVNDETGLKTIDLNEVEDKTLLINDAGDYLLSGTYYGQIYIATDDDEVVHLYLDGVNLYSKNGPVVYVESADKLVITMLEGSINVLSDSVNYKGFEEFKSSIYSNADVTFNGTGRLDIFGYYNDAVKSKGYIKLVDGTIQIRSKDIGLRANDGIFISDGNLDIQSEGTGIYTKNADKEGKGHVEILSGNLSVISGKNAIYAAADVRIFGGNVFANSVEEKVKSGGLQFIKEGCLQ